MALVVAPPSPMLPVEEAVMASLPAACSEALKAHVKRACDVLKSKEVELVMQATSVYRVNFFVAPPRVESNPPGPGSHPHRKGGAIGLARGAPGGVRRCAIRRREPRSDRAAGGFWTRAGGRPPSGRAPAPRTWPAHPIGASAPLPAARVRRRGRGAPVCRRRPLCGGPDRAYIA